MKKLKIVLLIIFISVQNLYSAEDWGRTGHRVTGEIAQKYLSRKAKKEISKLLDGHELAFTSTFSDEIRSDDRFKEFDAWHYVNFPFDSTYESEPKSERGDIIRGIEKCVSTLKSSNSSKEDKVFYLKMLVHFIGDLHQPLHIGLAEDRGGNRIQVEWFGEGTNLHTVWDTKMIESYNMSYSELAANADRLTKNQLEFYQKGTVIDWMYDSRKLCEDIYENTKAGDNLSYRYMYDYVNVVRTQLQKSGIRLATLLNGIFS